MVARERRLSLTFRAVRHGDAPCCCPFALFCDSQQAAIPSSRRDWEPGTAEVGAQGGRGNLEEEGDRRQWAGPVLVPMADDDEESPEIERTHVHDVYDTIAAHFSATRYKPWPRVMAFLDTLPAGSLVADVGCGNGKYMCGGRHIMMGSDRSRPLALLADARAAMPGCVCVGDATYVALRSGVFDAAISIAVLHHLSTRSRRLKALRELVRLVKRGGRVLVYAWSIEQGAESRFEFTAPDELVPWTVTSANARHAPENVVSAGPCVEAGTHHPASTASSSVEASAVGPDSRGGQDGPGVEGCAGGGEPLLRYCHLYRRGELTELCTSIAGAEVVEEYWDCSNCCIILQRH